MTPIEEIPKGVTVGDMSLEEFLRKTEEEEKEAEAKVDRRETIVKHKKNRPPIYRGMKYREVREPNGKVRHLTIKQIRKEYGFMSTLSQVEKVMEQFKDAPSPMPWLKLADICNKIDAPKRSISAIISSMKKMGMLDTIPSAEGRGYNYAIKPEYRIMSTTSLYSEYNRRTAEFRHEKLKSKKTTQTTTSPIAATSTTLPEGALNVINKLLNLGNELKVRVRIDIHIHLDKED